IYLWKGSINLIRNETREALRYFNESGALAQALGEDQLVAQTSFNAALVLNFQGRFGEAEPLFRDSINRMRKVGIPIEDVNALGQLGLSLAGQGYYAEGLAEAQQGLRMAQQRNHPGNLE